MLHEHGVHSAIAVQAGDTTGETLDLLALADKETGIAASWVGPISLHPTCRRRSTRLRAAPGGHRLVGLRHQLQVEPDTPWLADTHVRTGLGQLADRALV